MYARAKIKTIMYNTIFIYSNYYIWKLISALQVGIALSRATTKDILFLSRIFPCVEAQCTMVCYSK